MFSSSSSNTILSHSINAIGPAPHRGGRKREHRSIRFATITHIPSLHKIRRNAPRYHPTNPLATPIAGMFCCFHALRTCIVLMSSALSSRQLQHIKAQLQLAGALACAARYAHLYCAHVFCAVVQAGANKVKRQAAQRERQALQAAAQQNS
jgi:hypothetical protein